MTDIAIAVSSGVQTLNDHFGGDSWITDMDLDTLVLSDGDNCVLAQLFGSYSGGVRDLYGSSLYHAVRWSSDRGFTVHYDDDISWVDLTAHWKFVIAEMRRDRDIEDLRAALNGNPWTDRGEGVITSAAAEPIEFGVSTIREDALIAAGRRGIVDLYLAATGRPESDRTIVEAVLGLV